MPVRWSTVDVSDTRARRKQALGVGSWSSRLDRTVVRRLALNPMGMLPQDLLDTRRTIAAAAGIIISRQFTPEQEPEFIPQR
jgi:hypothetical protein